MPPSSRQTLSTNRAEEIDSNSNAHSNFNSHQNVASRSSQPQHRASSTSTSASNSPVPTQVSTSPPPPQHGYYSPSHSYSHPHLHQQQPSHAHGMNMGMMQSTSVSPSTSVPMSVGLTPGAPFYYHPYSLYPPHTHAPSHGHHGPPPPHPPAPPAPPRANRNNSSGHMSTSTSGSSYSGTSNADRTIQNTSTSYSTSSNSNRTLQSAFPTSDMSRPQLVPTFSYYRNQTNYDKQHHGFAGASQPEGRGKGKGEQNASALHAHNTSADVDHAEFEDDGNDEDGGDDDDDHTNDNDNDMGEYDEPMPMDAVDLGMELDLEPALVPTSGAMPSTSSGPNTLFRGTEKRSNHEYYPSPHHQAHFRDLMTADPSTPLSDPPISLNSLVDSEPGKKPAYPLPTIIRCAILGSPRQQLTLSELYLAMQRRFSYYTIGDGKSWRNSVRHNLSLNNLFQKVTRPITEPGKGCYWVVAHDKPPGNKRERKRNKKLGKRALAALEREKAAAATGGMSGGRTDDDEGDGGEDDDNSAGVERSTLPSSSSSLSRRGRATPTPITAPFPPYPQTSAVSSTTVLPSTTMSRPLFPFSRGTVAPNEGSYAAVTGVIPMPSQVPLPPNFGANMGVRGYGTNTPFGVHTPSGMTTGGPFSAFATAPTAAGTTAFGSTFGSASAGFEHSLNSGNANLPTTSGATHRASSNFANNPSKGKGKNGPTNGRVIPIPVAEGGGGNGGGRSSSQNQDSGAMNLSQTSSSQELGSASGMGGMTPTQATSIQTSQSQGLGRVSTPSAAFNSPSPSSSTTFLHQPLSAQSSFSSTGFSGLESVGSESHSGGFRETQQNQAFGPQSRTSRQNPARRFDHGGSGSTTSNVSASFAPTNRPRDTFNALAAQIASEFQNPNDTPLASGVEDTRTDISTSSRTAPGSRPVTQPPRKKRATLRRDSESEDGSESERSEEDDDDDDGDEYVPSRSGPGRRSGRRR